MFTMSQYVKIYYGPILSFNSLAHKPQKLQGLRDSLIKQGFRVDIIPVDYRKYCMIEINGYQVFRCNIENLQFNMPSELDPVCRRAISAVKECSIKLRRATNYFWLWGLIDDEIFLRSAYAPQNHWPVDVDIKPLTSCTTDCSKCCKMPSELI